MVLFILVSILGLVCLVGDAISKQIKEEKIQMELSYKRLKNF